MTNSGKTGRRELLCKLAGSAAVAGLAAALPRSAQGETSAQAETSSAAGSATVRVILSDGTSVQWLAVTDGGITVGDASASNLHLTDLVQSPSTGGGALMSFFCLNAVTANNTNYMFPASANTNCATTTNSSVQPASASGMIRNLEVFYGTPPGGSVMDTFTVFKCTAGQPLNTGCATTGINCTITGSPNPAVCYDTTRTAPVALGDGIQIRISAGVSSAGAAARVTLVIQ